LAPARAPESDKMCGMDAETIKAMLQQYFKHSRSDPDHAHAMYTEDAVLEMPQ
jgi:hypothetical protein